MESCTPTRFYTWHSDFPNATLRFLANLLGILLKKLVYLIWHFLYGGDEMIFLPNS